MHTNGSGARWPVSGAGRMIQGRQHYMKPADSLAFPAVSEREERARGAKLGLDRK